MSWKFFQGDVVDGEKKLRLLHTQQRVKQGAEKWSNIKRSHSTTYRTIILGWLKKKASSPSPVEKIYLLGYISTFENIA